MSGTQNLELNENGYLPPECFIVDLNEFKEKFVHVEDISKRELIYNKYKSFCERFQSIILKVRINGSYTTGKKLPDDIDVAVYYDALKFNDLSIINIAEKIAFNDKAGIKRTYMLHLLPVPVYPQDHPAYKMTEFHIEKWEKLFLKDDRINPPVKKGFIELTDYLE